MLLCGDSDGRMFARTGKTVCGGDGGAVVIFANLAANWLPSQGLLVPGCGSI